MKKLLMYTCLISFSGISAEAITFYNNADDPTTFAIDIGLVHPLQMPSVPGAESKENPVLDSALAHILVTHNINSIKIDAQNVSLHKVHCTSNRERIIPIPQGRTKEQLEAYLKERVVMFSPHSVKKRHEAKCTYR